MKRALILAIVAAVSLISVPARAGMLYLVCKYPSVADPRGMSKVEDSKLEIDLTNKTVNDGYGVYPAAISATSIYYKIEFNNISPHQLAEFLIDRIKGTVAWSHYIYTNVTIRSPTRIGHCTSSNTAPNTKF